MRLDHSPTRPRQPVLAVTPGEPAGIGPDCLLLSLPLLSSTAQVLAIADPDLLEARAEALGLKIRLHCISQPNAPLPEPAADTLVVLPIPLAASVQPGELDQRNAPYVLATLDAAIAGCQQGHFDALVTGPVQKSLINDAGIAFSGHTEYLAERCGVPRVVMMLATEGLRVALVTTHLPLARVPAAITQPVLEETLQILHHDLKQRFGLTHPRILVCGLNPHAGENGHLGREEIEILNPVLERCRSQGMDLRGPLPADTLFTDKYLRQADAVLAMYHDQGLPVLKYKGFGQAVNMTLGLPILRTSVDHGTALDLAGTGRADPGSLLSALNMAASLARNSFSHD